MIRSSLMLAKVYKSHFVFFLLTRDMSAACCLISFILFLAVLDNSPGPTDDALELLTEPGFILDDDDDDSEGREDNDDADPTALLFSVCNDL